ncbi:CHAD domain-containing protein [Roseitranquillus sediminis]|uniref:CHAD domain-containing protein n=1 Tax=Roseitranquillus sediminis TaxID=2809051 RepID=UPI00222166C7|nr:CHAD domain-containing protein [Roseitranquillus sediminis]
MEQLDRAIASAEDAGDPAPRVHDIRKRMKKLRGLIRLVRPVFPDYRMENRVARDTARSVSGLRDLTVLAQTYDLLMERHDQQLDRTAFAPLRRHYTVAKADVDLTEPLAAAAETLARTRERVPLWTLSDTGFDAIEGGLLKTYGRARNGPEDDDDAALHEWRKRVKYHLYHVRLLQEIWPEQMEVRRAALDDLGDRLGHHQDLVVFAASLDDSPLDEDARRVLRGIVDRQKAATAAEARDLAARLFVDKPKVLAGRWRAWWDRWRAD